MYNPYTGAVYYGGNDYRDYLAHSKGPWLKPTKYLKKIGEGANAVYVYAKDKIMGTSHGQAASRHADVAMKARANYKKAEAAAKKATPGSLSSKIARSQRDAAKTVYDEYSRKYNESMRKYNNSIGQRAIRAAYGAKAAINSGRRSVHRAINSGVKIARTALGKLRTAAGSLIERGRSLISRLLGGAKSAAWKAENTLRKEFIGKPVQKKLNDDMHNLYSKNSAGRRNARTVEQNNRRKVRRRGIAQ